MIQGALPIIAAALGRHYGVRVVVGNGEQPRTDGGTIYIPTLDDSSESMILANGFVDHEAAHVRHTDFDLHFISDFEQSIWNSIEDVRCEGEQGKLYPGCAKNFVRTVEVLVQNGFFTNPQWIKEPGRVLDAWTLYMLRSEILHQSTQEYAETARNALHSVFGSGLATSAEQLLLDKVPKAKSSRDSQIIARELISLMCGETPPQPQKGSSGKEGDSGQSGKDKNQSPEGSPSGGNSPGDNNDNPSQSPKQESQEGGSGKDGDKHPDGKPSKGNSAGDKGKSPVSRKQLESTKPEDLSKGVGELLREAVADRSGKGNPDTSAVDPGWENGGNGAGTQPAGHSSAQTTLNMGRVKKVADTIRAKVLAKLQASDQRRVYPKRYGRRLDYRNLHRIGVGDLRVFEGRSEARSFNTAIHLLLDRSGSMEEKMSPLCESGLAIASGLYGARGVSLGSSVFPAHTPSNVQLILPHGNPVRPSDFSISSFGGTPLDSALWYVIRNMVRLRQKRKIILVATDGIPNDEAKTCQMAQLARDIGFETYGIAIVQGDSVERRDVMEVHMREIFLPENTALITDIYQLTDAMMHIIDKAFTI